MARRTSLDDSDAILTQQLLDSLNLGAQDAPASSVQAKLAIHGVVIGVQNDLARVSGLRHATVGSVVAVRDGDGQFCCHGLVLMLETKLVHVALLKATTETLPVTKGMHVELHHEQLEIPGSVAAFTGAVIDPLGRALSMDESRAQHEPKERIHVGWGAQSVPGLMQRVPLSLPFETGFVALDCLHPMAHGHRFGIFGPRHAGKTRLALDVMVHQVARAKELGHVPPHIVYVCIGKSLARIARIREVLKTTETLSHTTIIAAHDCDSPVLQYIAPFTGCAVAEYMMQHSRSPHSVVVYDDLATHTSVVEGFVHSLHLPRAARTSLSAHAVLLERSGQFQGVSNERTGPSVTSLVLVDTPAASEKPSDLQEGISSLVDDFVCLDPSSPDFPPLNVLTPGGSVRGPPFQSAARWTFISRLRARINAAARVKENVEVACKLGLEPEPEDAETLEFLALVEQFFNTSTLIGQKGTIESELEILVAAMFLSNVNVVKLPTEPLNLWEFVRQVITRLMRKENEDIWIQLTTQERTSAWSKRLEANVAKVVDEELERLKLAKKQKSTKIASIT
ncbi:hypothetical protein PsorP6_015678 [Peronosclerospora sorghi]|uniref:Uncharacterized protein n=1 Tax=Peronosclerospora sorghi TaxID=230839 RepID=A0ACC0WR05_9STRA|nr:hypothetical protein PsorP6_015678 [Peronosclerospora sorghi]